LVKILFLFSPTLAASREREGEVSSAMGLAKLPFSGPALHVQFAVTILHMMRCAAPPWGPPHLVPKTEITSLPFT
jgi:hypothetical protein